MYRTILIQSGGPGDRTPRREKAGGHSVEEIAAAIRELLASPALAHRLGDAARRDVLERFTVDHMVRRTMEVYRRVLA